MGANSEKAGSGKDQLQGNLTAWLVLSVLAGSFGSSFLFGYNVGVLNAPQTVVGLWIRQTICLRDGKTPSEEEGGSDDIWCKKLGPEAQLSMFADNTQLNSIWAMVNSFVPGGAVVGALVSPIFASRFGPKRSMLLNNIVAIIAVLLTSLSFTAGSYEMLIVGRFIAGVNSGISAGITPAYLTEVAPPSLRGTIGSFHQFFIIFSIWISQIIGLPFIFGNATLWPVLLGLAAVPTVYQLATLPLCPDSPKYLFFNKRDVEGARAALQTLRGTPHVEEELAVMQVEYDQIKDDPVVTTKDLFTDPFLRRSLIIALGLMLCQQFSGIDAVMFYSTNIFQSAGLVDLEPVYATIGTGAVNVLMTFVALVLVEKAGRRTLLLIGDFGMCLFLTLLTICMLLYKTGIPGADNPAATNSFAWAAYGSSASLFGFVIMFATGPGAIPWIMMSELFAQGPRGAAAGVLAGANRFFSLIVTLTFPYLQASIEEYSFIIFAVFLAFAIIFTYIFMIETKGKTTDEIQAILRSKMAKKHNESVEMSAAK